MARAAVESPAPSPSIPKWRRRAMIAVGGVLLAALLASPVWAPRVGRRLAFFRVRKVEIVGLRYTPASEILQRLQVDTTVSVWDELAPLSARVARHPQVEHASISRRLPGTLVVDVTERRPVALVNSPAGLRAVDIRGVALPLDPSITPVDLPIVVATSRDTAVFQLLDAMQRERPLLFARIESLTRVGADELLLRVASLPVRTMTNVTLARLSDIEPVEQDLARRQLHASELDLRYRDQVIARLQ